MLWSGKMDWLRSHGQTLITLPPNQCYPTKTPTVFHPWQTDRFPQQTISVHCQSERLRLQEISGTCHRNISDRQYVTKPLQGGKGFPVFSERKGLPSRKNRLEVGKNMIGNRKNVPNHSFKRYVSFRQTIRIFWSNNTYLLNKQYVCYLTSVRTEFINNYTLLSSCIAPKEPSTSQPSYSSHRHL